MISIIVAMSMPELSLIFFMGLFLVLVLRLTLSRTMRWERDARIPLDDTNEVGADHDH